MKKTKKVVLLLVIIGKIAIGNMAAKIQNVPAIMPDLSYLSDGNYAGEYSLLPVHVKVHVSVNLPLLQ